MGKSLIFIVLILANSISFAQTEINRSSGRRSQERSYHEAMELFSKTKLAEQFYVSSEGITITEDEGLEKRLSSFSKNSILILGLYSSLTHSMFGYLNIHWDELLKTRPELRYFKLRPDIHYVFELEIMEKQNIHNRYNKRLLEGMISLARNKNFKTSFLVHSEKMKNFLLNSGVDQQKINSLPHLFLNQIYSGKNLKSSSQKDLKTLFQHSPEDAYRILFLGNSAIVDFHRFFAGFKTKWLKDPNSRNLTFVYAPHPNFDISFIDGLSESLLTEHPNGKTLSVAVNFYESSLSSADLIPKVDLTLGEHSTLGFIAKDIGYDVVLNNEIDRRAYIETAFEAYRKNISSRNFYPSQSRKMADTKAWLKFMRSLQGSDSSCKASAK